MIAAAAMSLSSVCVVSNALRLRGWKPGFPAGGEASTGARRAPADRKEDGGAEAPGRKETAMEKTLHVEGMMCAHCVAHVKKALEGVEGVEETVVDLDAGTACAKLSHDVADEALAAAVEDAGYQVESVS